MNLKYLLVLGIMVLPSLLSAQTDKREVRKGNREYRKGEYKEAEIDYRKALVKDSLSFAANYNLGSVLYRQNDAEGALSAMKKVENQAVAAGYGADYYFNLGDMALAKKDYKTAVEAFAKSLMIRPEDLDAKENFIYARKMLENQQQNQQNQNQDQNNQDQNQDRNQDKNQDQDRNDDSNQDQNQNRDDRNQDQHKNQEQEQQSPQEAKISPQAAQQMLQAIQAREKETQDKVNREKAAVMKSRQKEKNW